MVSSVTLALRAGDCSLTVSVIAKVDLSQKDQPAPVLRWSPNTKILAGYAGSNAFLLDPNGRVLAKKDFDLVRATDAVFLDDSTALFLFSNSSSSFVAKINEDGTAETKDIDKKGYRFGVDESGNLIVVGKSGKSVPELGGMVLANSFLRKDYLKDIRKIISQRERKFGLKDFKIDGDALMISDNEKISFAIQNAVLKERLAINRNGVREYVWLATDSAVNLRAGFILRSEKIEDGHNYLGAKLVLQDLVDDSRCTLALQSSKIPLNPAVSADGLRLAWVENDSGRVFLGTMGKSPIINGK
jgi:hypothetical protein